jgi:hypothetical protein
MVSKLSVREKKVGSAMEQLTCKMKRELLTHYGPKIVVVVFVLFQLSWRRDSCWALQEGVKWIGDQSRRL